MLHKQERRQCSTPVIVTQLVTQARLLSFVVFGTLLFLPIYAQQRTPSRTARLTLSLLALARPRVANMRRKMQERVGVAEVNGRFMRTSQPLFQAGLNAQIAPVRGKAGQYTGMVRIPIVWRSPDQSFFDTRKEAEQTELNEAEPGHLKLLYAYAQGRWTYQRAQWGE